MARLAVLFALLGVFVICLPSASATSIQVVSTGTDFVIWNAGVDNLPIVDFSLTSNPGGIFSTDPFEFQFEASDSSVQIARPSGSIFALPFSGVEATATYFPAGTTIDSSLSYVGASPFLTSDVLNNDAVNGLNYLGFTLTDTSDAIHYGWLAFDLSQFSDGATAISFVTGAVESSPETPTTTPEPAALILVLLGAASLLAQHRRRRAD